MLNQQLLDDMTRRMVDQKHVFSTVLCVENEDQSLALTSAAGQMQADDAYFIASVTKLYVTAVMILLTQEKKLRLTDKIHPYFSEGQLEGIHKLNGVDYLNEITIQHLISNTSGIPDYFFGKDSQGRTGADDLLSGQDSDWSLEKTLALVRNLQPKFRPGQKGKAEYSDTNYQLLGHIIEKATGRPVRDVFQQYLFQPLGLKATYVYSDPADEKPVAMYVGQSALQVPKYMASIPAEGGIVSTAGECMRFLKAFFNGTFFAAARIEELKEWRFMLRPATMYFGVGLEKLWTPWFMSPTRPVRNILGFWGQTGSFAFYHQDSGLYFTGTTNQINGMGHNAAYKAMLRIIRQA